MLGGIESERARRFLADEGIVVDLGKPLRGSHFAHSVVKRALGIRRRNARGRQRSDGRDVVVADHAADFFHQIVLDGDVLGGAPARHGP